MELWAVFCCVLVVYALTAAPSVAGGDSGELLAESCQLGYAHPPGHLLLTPPALNLLQKNTCWSTPLFPRKLERFARRVPELRVCVVT